MSPTDSQPVAAALLIIDAQQSFEHCTYWDPTHAPAFYERVQKLIDGARARRVPVVQVFHVEESGPFSMASGHIRTLSSLSFEPDVIIHTRRHGALVGTSLSPWLVEHGIRRLIVAGIRTE